MRPLEPLLASLRRCLDGFPDKRRGLNTTYRMADIGMAAFSVFFTQSPSFLAHQRRLEHGHGRSNCESLFQIARIPSDNHIRDMLDPAEPQRLHPVFADTVAALERITSGLETFRRLGDHVLIALDGTEYFCSKTIHCQHCSTRLRGKDGLASHGPRYARLNPIYLGDDLFSRQPLCEAVRQLGGHFIFVCKPSSHPLIAEYTTGIDLATHQEMVKRGKKQTIFRYRWICHVPLRGGNDAVLVNWFEIEIVNAKGEVTYRNSFITDLPVGPHNVAELAACGRARWKIENETFNVLKTKGYNIEHSFGHGKRQLAAILVTLNLLAFAIHTVCDIGDELWRSARQKLGSRSQFFNNLAAITTFLIFTSWQDLLQTLAFAKPPPVPP